MKFDAFGKKIWLATDTKHDEEKKYIQEAFDINRITAEGTNLVEIERQMSEKVGCRYAVALSCGMAALQRGFVTREGNVRGRTNASISDKRVDVGADIFGRGLCLLGDIKMTTEKQDMIVRTIRSCFE